MYYLILTHYRFRERLHTKFLKSRKPGDTSKTLQGGKWTYVQDGLDDFRDGLPPRLDGAEVFKVMNGCSPRVGTRYSIYCSSFFLNIFYIK